MPSASTLMTGDDYSGNWKNMVGIPGELVTRCRLIDLSDTPASAGVGYGIFHLPSFTFLKDIYVVKISCCSSDDAEIHLGDHNASKAMYSDISFSGSTDWYGGVRVASKNSIMTGCCFYKDGGEIQYVCSDSQSEGAFWVVIQTINLNPVL